MEEYFRLANRCNHLHVESFIRRAFDEMILDAPPGYDYLEKYRSYIPMDHPIFKTI